MSNEKLESGLIDSLQHIKNEIESEGYSIINNIFSNKEIERLLLIIENSETNKPTFRITDDLFAIRQFFKEVPDSIEIVFNEKLRSIISNLFGKDYFVVKSIYFDKPEKSNWFVAYHQDLTISVDKKIDIKDFGPWTVKQNQFSVQPPLKILEENFTIRIHLDETNDENGALKVLPKSHLSGICRLDSMSFKKENEKVCDVKKGGIMIMKPLLFHASGRTTNNHKRRVIHIEFGKSLLPADLKWSEYLEIKSQTFITKKD
ncbi:MAG TPA: phytanoyl-CoA dioxygenase family protein [Puia sp.]|nr:phytanoyl-CoA dioxygenase family protein [Puia sp.]